MHLKLILYKEPFDQIIAGTKVEEYRDFTPFYIARLCTKNKAGEITGFKPYKKVTFYNGYRKDRPQFDIECRGIEILTEKNTGEKIFAILLGKML